MSREKPQKKYSSFIVSVVIHVVVLTVLVVSFDFSGKMPVLENSPQNNQIIHAMVVNAPPQPIKTPEPVLPKPVEPQPVKPMPPKKVIEKKPEIMQTKKPTIVIPDKKQKQREQEKMAQDLLADMKKQKNMQKKAKYNEIAKAFENEIKQLKTKSLTQDIQRAEKPLSGANVAQAQGEVDKYKALILQAISQHWLLPPNVDKKLTAQLLIRLAPGGTVLDVQLIKSSGNDAIDRSARSAVYKASPLPVPDHSAEFEAFRQFVLKVKPENVMESDHWTR